MVLLFKHRAQNLTQFSVVEYVYNFIIETEQHANANIPSESDFQELNI